MTIALEVATSGGLAAVALRGELDIHSAPELRAALVALLDAGATQVVLDLSGVAFMDSSGLGVLVGTHKRLDALGRRLQLVGVHGPVERLLTVTGLTRVFDVRDATGIALRPVTPVIDDRYPLPPGAAGSPTIDPERSTMSTTLLVLRTRVRR